MSGFSLQLCYVFKSEIWTALLENKLNRSGREHEKISSPHFDNILKPTPDAEIPQKDKEKYQEEFEHFQQELDKKKEEFQKEHPDVQGQPGKLFLCGGFLLGGMFVGVVCAFSFFLFFGVCVSVVVEENICFPGYLELGPDTLTGLTRLLLMLFTLFKGLWLFVCKVFSEIWSHFCHAWIENKANEWKWDGNDENLYGTAEGRGGRASLCEVMIKEVWPSWLFGSVFERPSFWSFWTFMTNFFHLVLWMVIKDGLVGMLEHVPAWKSFWMLA